MPDQFEDFLARYRERCNRLLENRIRTLPRYENPLLDAVHYSLLLGGKRVRPTLVYAAAHAVGEVNQATDDFACAVEAIHSYSLIHDDLPAMDDDDLRRGQPSCHRAFDEATAILAGDALQCLAFDWVSHNPTLEPAATLRAVQALSLGAGVRGMVMGQAIDLAAVDQCIDLPQLESMHQHKTGALIVASAQLGALSAGASDAQYEALSHYARAIGLAFQVQDDILDVTSDIEKLGKATGADADRNKPTYVSLLGLDGARDKAAELLKTAEDALRLFDDRADPLRELARYIVQRDH